MTPQEQQGAYDAKVREIARELLREDDFNKGLEADYYQFEYYSELYEQYLK